MLLIAVSVLPEQALVFAWKASLRPSLYSYMEKDWLLALKGKNQPRRTGISPNCETNSLTVNA